MGGDSFVFVYLRPEETPYLVAFTCRATDRSLLPTADWFYFSFERDFCCLEYK